MHSNGNTIGIPTQNELLAACRELTAHLSDYAISATNFDEDAFAACERAERLLFEATLRRP